MRVSETTSPKKCPSSTRLRLRKLLTIALKDPLERAKLNASMICSREEEEEEEDEEDEGDVAGVVAGVGGTVITEGQQQS